METFQVGGDMDSPHLLLAEQSNVDLASRFRQSTRIQGPPDPDNKHACRALFQEQTYDPREE